MVFGIFSSLAEYERELIRERINAGLSRAKAEGKKLGRPSNVNEETKDKVVQLRNDGMAIKKIVKELHIGVATTRKLLAA